MPTEPTTAPAARVAPAAPDRAPTYAEQVRAAWADTRIWDYLRYDDAGDLWLGGLRVRDAVARYGAPLEIVDTTMIARRCREWMDLAGSVASEVGYGGRLGFLYASKANMASEVTAAAYRSGWGAETSARQDLMHLVWLERHGLLPSGMRVVCNGFKLPRDLYSLPDRDAGPPGGNVVLPADSLARGLREVTYAEAIIGLARDGWDITPILDEGELEAFASAPVAMNVGLRMKCGHVASPAELDGVVSRFGLARDALAAEADRIAAVPNLRLTTLHAMVGAAETIPVDEFARALLAAAEVWAGLRSAHPSLVELNLGGGVPPLGDPYDHRAFLATYLSGLRDLAAFAGVPAPDVTFELGTLVASECGFHVLPVLQHKRNHVAAPGEIDRWAIVDGGLMAAIPDMLLIGKAFRVLAVEGAGRPSVRVRLGDVTCDSDGRYPPESFGPDAAVLLPDADGPQHVLIQGVGAYQEILAGVRGAHHCGLLEAAELVLEERADGRVHGRLLGRQTPASAALLLGYADETVPALAAALAAAGPARAAFAEGAPDPTT